MTCASFHIHSDHFERQWRVWIAGNKPLLATGLISRQTYIIDTLITRNDCSQVGCGLLLILLLPLFLLRGSVLCPRLRIHAMGWILVEELP